MAKKRLSRRDLNLLERVKCARIVLIDRLVDDAIYFAPAADLLGEAAPTYVKLAAELNTVLVQDDQANVEKHALRFLLAILESRDTAPVDTGAARPAWAAPA